MKNIGDWIELRNIAIELMTDKNYTKKQDKVKKIVGEAVYKLKQLKEK